MSSLMIACLYLAFGIYYTEYEALHDALFSGSLSPGFSFPSLYFIGHIGTGYVYAWLYQMVPEIDWIAWISYFGYAMSGAVGLSALDSLLGVSINRLERMLFGILILLMIYADQYIHFVYTRLSYMLCGSALLGMVIGAYLHPSSYTFKKWLPLLLIFVYGFLTRIETAFDSVILLSGIGLFMLPNLRSVLLVFLIPGLLTTGAIVWVMRDIQQSVEHHKQIEYEIETELLEQENMIRLPGAASVEEKAKYAMAGIVFWQDPIHMPSTYLRSLMARPFHLFDKARWIRSVQKIQTALLSHLWLTFLWVTLSLIVWWHAPKKTWLQNLRLYWLLMCFPVLILFQTYSVTINTRSFVPMLSLHLLALTTAILCLSIVKKPNGFRRMGLPLFLVMVALIQLFHLSDAARTQRELRGRREVLMAQMIEAGRNKVLAINASVFEPFFLSKKPFTPFDYSMFKAVYITEGHVLPLIPFYRDYLQSVCKCDVSLYPSFWDYLIQNQEPLLVASDPFNWEIIQNYQRIIHHRDYCFQEYKPSIRIPEGWLSKISLWERCSIEDNISIYR